MNKRKIVYGLHEDALMGWKVLLKQALCDVLCVALMLLTDCSSNTVLMSSDQSYADLYSTVVMKHMSQVDWACSCCVLLVSLLYVLSLFTVNVLLPLCVQLPIAADACASAVAYAVTIVCAGGHCNSSCCLWCYCYCMYCCCCICCCLCRYCSIWSRLLLHVPLLPWFELLLLPMALLMPTVCCICCCVLSVWLLHVLRHCQFGCSK